MRAIKQWSKNISIAPWFWLQYRSYSSLLVDGTSVKWQLHTTITTAQTLAIRDVQAFIFIYLFIFLHSWKKRRQVVHLSYYY